MKRLVFALAFLTACSTTPENLVQKSSTRTATFQYAENYQEIFRRVSTVAKRCLDRPTSFNSNAQNHIDAQLYSELGYGEVTMVFKSAIVTNYFWNAKVERIGTGSRLIISSGNTINNDMWLGRVKVWGDGGQECPAF